MKDRYLNLVMIIIAICLVYIAFLKPMPQRYTIKEENTETKSGDFVYFTTNIILFDTATGNEYVYNRLQTFNSKDGTDKKDDSYVIRNQVKRKIIHKNIDKDFKVIGWKENK